MTGLCGVRGELVEQPLNAGVEVVANCAHPIQRQAFGIGDCPVEVPLARIDGARITATHRHHDIGGGDDIVGQRFGEVVAQVDPDLGHRLDHGGVDRMDRR